MRLLICFLLESLCIVIQAEGEVNTVMQVRHNVLTVVVSVVIVDARCYRIYKSTIVLKHRQQHVRVALKNHFNNLDNNSFPYFSFFLNKLSCLRGKNGGIHTPEHVYSEKL